MWGEKVADMCAACTGMRVPVRLIIKAENTLSFLPWKEVLGKGDVGKKLGSHGHRGTLKRGGMDHMARQG